MDPATDDMTSARTLMYAIRQPRLTSTCEICRKGARMHQGAGGALAPTPRPAGITYPFEGGETIRTRTTLRPSLP